MKERPQLLSASKQTRRYEGLVIGIGMHSYLTDKVFFLHKAVHNVTIHIFSFKSIFKERFNFNSLSSTKGISRRQQSVPQIDGRVVCNSWGKLRQKTAIISL